MRKLFYIGVLGILFSSCKKEDKYPDIIVFGHAGDGIDISSAPYQENTYEAVEYALSYNEIKGVEVDVQWSKDGTIWLYHDIDLNAQTNSEGKIADKTDLELEQVKYKGLNGEKLRKLEEILPLIGGKELFLDIKRPSGVDLTLQQIQDGFDKLNPSISGLNVSVILPSPSNIQYFIDLGWDAYLFQVETADYLSDAGFTQSHGCAISNTKISAAEVNQLQSLNKKVIIFNARAPKTIRQALKKKPDFFLADDIRGTLIEKIR